MCGLFFSTNSTVDCAAIGNFLRARGTQPVNWHFSKLGWVYGHALLPVQGRHPHLQPVNQQNATLLYTGELWDSPAVSDTQYLMDQLLSRSVTAVAKSLRGMWAFVLTRKGRVYFATDEMGIQSLHFAIVNGHLFVASEIKLLVAAGVRHEQTQHVLPGILYQFKDELRAARYTRSFLMSKSSGFSAKRLRERITTGVRRVASASHMQKMAVLLSGGIDSAIVAYEAKQLGIERAFCVASRVDALDVIGATATAEFLDIELTVHIVQPKTLKSTIAVIEHANRSIVEEMTLHLHLAEFVANCGYRILLSGCGADELFLGYKHLLGRIPHDQLQQRNLDTYYRFDLRAFNKAYAYQAVEVRHPYLEHELVAYARRLHHVMLLGPKKQMKWPLREAYRDVFPALASQKTLIARETMGVKSHFACRYGDSPYIYRPTFKELFASAGNLRRALNN